MLMIDIDMPDNCDECRFNTEYGFCKAMPDNCCRNTDNRKRPEWCPLKEPKAKQVDSEKQPEKPPIGCKPYYVAISERIGELCEAIRRCAGEKGKHNSVKLWAAEINILNEMDRILRRVESEKTWVEDKDGTLKEVE